MRSARVPRASAARVVAVGAIAALLGWGGDARAIDFDVAGEAHFDPAALVHEGFEAFADSDGVTTVTADDALEGSHYVVVDVQPGAPVTIPLPLPAATAAYRARLFARTNRVVGDVLVSYAGDVGTPLAIARLFPTGRMTSDGWYEIATAAFTFEGARSGAKAALGMVASGADVDALEIVPAGEPPRTHRACAPPVDAVCAADETCGGGVCRPMAPLVPPLPATVDRAAVAAYLRERVRLFFGGKFTRATTLPAALATLDTMASATDAWTFWNTFVTALHQLHDWHTTVTPPFDVGPRGLLPVCFVEGNADLSRAIAPSDPVLPDVIVSHAGADGNQVHLHAGDRLVAINGVHPIAFVESLDGVDWTAWRADDPAVHAEAVERLRQVIRRYATTLTVIRCDSQTKVCAAPDTLKVDDLPPDDGSVIYPTCDHRPLYHLASGNPDALTHTVNGVYEGPLVMTTPEEALYGMIFDDVLADSSGAPFAAPLADVAAHAKGLVIDHRTGNGGTEDVAELVTQTLRAPATLGAMTGFDLTSGLLDPPFDPVQGATLFLAHDAEPDAYDVGSATARTDLRTALLLARDGSASDWLAFGLARSPNVRVFGRRTAGAFSSFFEFDYYGSFAWRLASGDFVLPDGTTHLGAGVLPDEELLPLQSDLLHGKDTVYERALAWVRGQ